ncbi:hypothetical protein [Streptomyces sp. RKAG293]|uniref:hypothetical protein n=1 Tax=Streptomyces sp. RKAG293 TaxID=2893403 RepID=UPI0020340A23|nr:hypothetical protein [Streptomyces sp. RKAG293]MCM2420626.1 hypothetical protein [Streptomyces sp. RKAG293]
MHLSIINVVEHNYGAYFHQGETGCEIRASPECHFARTKNWTNSWQELSFSRLDPGGKLRFIRSGAMLVSTAIVTTAVMLAAPSMATADAGDAVSSSEVATALNSTDARNGSLVAEPVKSTTDADSAAVVKQGGVTMEVPKNPEDGVFLKSEGAPPVTIDLPNANEAKDATRLSDGTVIYPGTNGSASAVIPTTTGIQMLTTIASSDAPTRFAYKVAVPAGGRVELAEDGSATILDGEGAIVVAAATPWAKDANGVAVPTRFETDGTTLTQVVDHASGRFAYPVVADPNWFSQTINMIMGCFGLKDLARMGLAKVMVVLGKRMIVRLIPYVGWVSCGIGAYAGWNG